MADANQIMTAEYPILENDAIREAVFEIRFRCGPDFIPEIFYGRMSDVEAWKGFRAVRLPISDIPDAVRRSDPGLQFKPIIELVSPDGKTAMRMGPDVIILSRRGDYQGWDGGYGADIKNMSEHLFSVLGELSVVRLGLRYINAIRSDLHGIKGPKDLAVGINVAEHEVQSEFSLNFVTQRGSHFEAMNRLSTVEFAGGAIPDNTTFVIDIDVRTGDGYSASSVAEILDWASEARKEKNKRFFSVLGKDNIERLRKKS